MIRPIYALLKSSTSPIVTLECIKWIFNASILVPTILNHSAEAVSVFTFIYNSYEIVF